MPGRQRRHPCRERSRRAALLLAGRAVERLRPARLRYLREAAAGAGFAATVHDSLAALRLAGAGAGALRRGRLEDDGKAADLKAILAGYRNNFV